MTQDHEIISLYKAKGFALSATLTDMLNELYIHRTERRGCGYTQSTRLLAGYINVSRNADDYSDLKLFLDYDIRPLKRILELSRVSGLNLQDWHNLDINGEVQTFIHSTGDSELKNLLQQQSDFQSLLRQTASEVSLEESKLLCGLIQDVILPKTSQSSGFVELKPLDEKPKVGSCPMAEQFFLKIAHRRVLRQGELNVFVDAEQRPLLLEKMNMGDNHSCISLQPLLMNGVQLPPGSLFSVDYDRDLIQNKIPNREYAGFVMPFSEISGFWFLRFTTLAISPENRKRAFTTHFEQQVANGLFSPGVTQLQQLIDVAQAQIRG